MNATTTTPATVRAARRIELQGAVEALVRTGGWAKEAALANDHERFVRESEILVEIERMTGRRFGLGSMSL